MEAATPPATGERVESVRSADGTDIAFVRTGSGPPVVVIHGIGFDHTFWKLSDIQAALAENYTVVAIDRRGRGASGDAAEYGLEREIEDVAAVVGSIDEPVTLLGHSFGALIALEAATRIDTLDRLVLYEPGISFETGFPPMEHLLGRIQPLIADGDTEDALVTFLDAVGMPDTALKALRSGANWSGLVAAVETLPREFDALIEYAMDTDRFSDVTIPVLLLVGEASSDGAIRTTETLAEILPNSRISRIEGADHFGLLSRPDLCVDAIFAFRDAT